MGTCHKTGIKNQFRGVAILVENWDTWLKTVAGQKVVGRKVVVRHFVS